MVCMCVLGNDGPDVIATGLEELPDVNECVVSYSTAYEYFSKVNDSFRAAKVLSHIASTYLDTIFHTVCVRNIPLHHLAPWLGRHGFDVKASDADLPAEARERKLRQALRRIEVPASSALKTLADCLNPLKMLSCLVNMAELRAIAGEWQQALLYWKECRDAFISLYFNHTKFVLMPDATPAFLEKVEAFFKRLTRLMLMFDQSVISKVRCANVSLLRLSTLFLCRTCWCWTHSWCSRSSWMHVGCTAARVHMQTPLRPLLQRRRRRRWR